MRKLITKIVDKLAPVAKAIVGAATPIIVAFVLDWLADLSDLVRNIGAGAASGLAVYATRNRR